MRHPPFITGTEKASNIDYLSEDGAHKLARIIRAAWAQIGHDVPVSVVRITRPVHEDRTRGPIFSVYMPTLVNGLPVT